MASTTVKRYIHPRKLNQSNSSTEQRKLQNQISSYGPQNRADVARLLEARVENLSNPMTVRAMDTFINECASMVDRVLRAHGVAVCAVLLGLLLMAAPHQVIGQDIHHAPTIEQCKADAAAWSDNANLFTFESLSSFQEIDGRVGELAECMGNLELSPAVRKSAYLLAARYSVTTANRMSHFLTRHSLYKQFMDEDAKGAR